MRRILVFAILLAMSAVPALAGSHPSLTVLTRDGKRQTYAFSDFDGKRLTFELKLGKQDREIGLREIGCFAFAALDSSAAVAHSRDSLDNFSMLDGRSLRGILRAMDTDELQVLLEGEGLKAKKLVLSSVAQVSFGSGILDVDRREFGTGFNLFGDDTEVELAKGMAAEIDSEVPALSDPAVSAYVDSLGRALAQASKRPGIPYTFTVLDSRQVNAFTVGGGRVYVYRGLLEQMGSEGELAGVLAHEIGHNVGRHPARQLSKTLLMQGIISAGGELLKSRSQDLGTAFESLGGVLAYLKTLKFSRDDEREADYLAVYNLYQQGLDPRGLVSALETLKRNEAGEPTRFEVFFQTHPSLTERIENTSGELPKLDLSHLRTDSTRFRTMESRLAGRPWPTLHQRLISDSLVVKASTSRTYTVPIDTTVTRECVFRGRVVASGGSGNDIRVLVLDETNYLNWSNGHAAKPLYDSGKVTVAEVSARVGATGKYFLVLDNGFSLLTDKVVKIGVYAEYKE